MESNIDKIQLNSFVKQNTMQYSTSQYVEEYKCNTTTAFNIIKNFKKGERYQESVGRLAITGQITNAPSAPNKFEWVLSEATLTEQAGGDNSILHLEFTLKEDDASEDTFVKDVTLSWRPYQTPVLAFCKNDYHEDKTSSEPRAPANQTCVSKHIDLYVKCPQKIELSANNEVALGYTQDGCRALVLNPRECVIADKINKGIEYITYHVPVINVVEESKILSTNWNQDNPFDNVAYEIDTKVEAIPGGAIDLAVPIWAKSGSSWNWVNVIDNLQCEFLDKMNQNHIWRRTRQYEGFIVLDENFYGRTKIGEIDGRWQIGTM